MSVYKIIMLSILSFVQIAHGMQDKNYNKFFLLLKYHLYPTQETLTDSEYIERLDKFFTLELGKDLDFNQRFSDKVLDYGAHENIVGLTPLHVAIIFERFDIIPYLTYKDADVNAVDDWNPVQLQTPLDFLEFNINMEKLSDSKMGKQYVEDISAMQRFLKSKGAEHGKFIKKQIEKYGGVGGFNIDQSYFDEIRN